MNKFYHVQRLLRFDLLSKKSPFPKEPKPVRKPFQKPGKVCERVSEIFKRFQIYLLGFRDLGNPGVPYNTEFNAFEVFWNTFFLMSETKLCPRKPLGYCRKPILPEKLSWYPNGFGRIPFRFPKPFIGNLKGFREY